MSFDSSRALELLRLGTRLPEISFRSDQEEAIRHVVEGRGRLLVVQKTGWGKSFVYFIAAKLLREQRTPTGSHIFGPALLVSPLISLMRNQIAAAERMGVRALTINSDNFHEWNEIEEMVLRDQVDILLISPERLANERFRHQVLNIISSRVSLLVIDEAHCISDWGHDFRPHYRLLERIVRQLPPNLRLLATTATANDRVMEDLQKVLGPNLKVLRGDLNRPSLLLQTIRLSDQSERLGWLAEQVPKIPGSGIIYTLTVRDAVKLANWLRSKNINVAAYTSEAENRAELEQALLDNRVKALVATTALGMGFDKPDLAFVIHYQAPASVVAYYQQVGRAGRALKSAYGVLLSGEEENQINEYFIDSAFPTREEAQQVISALSAQGGLSVNEIMVHANLTMGRIQKTLDLLSLESPAPVVKRGAKWSLTPARLMESFWERTARLTEIRRAELRQMQKYVRLESDHMAFLVRALDGDPANIVRPELPPLARVAQPSLVIDAKEFLQRTNLPLEPRQKWPAGGMERYGLRGSIPADLRVQEGRVLCHWRDDGWGEMIRKGKYCDGRFANELVEACASLVERWLPTPEPTWLTCIPSLRHPTLVPDFAERLAKRLQLPFRLALRKTTERPEQKQMQNSIQQARNLDGSLAVSGPVPSGSVLLIDDMVDSRWTMTVAGWLLRSCGSGEVFPLALADTGRG